MTPSCRRQSPPVHLVSVFTHNTHARTHACTHTHTHLFLTCDFLTLDQIPKITVACFFVVLGYTCISTSTATTRE